MVVDLRQGIAMTGTHLLAPIVGLENGGIRLRRMYFHPGKKGRAEIEAYPSIVVDNIDNAAASAKKAGSGVRGITFRIDPLVPVMVGTGRIIDFHFFQPGIFPRRLVKMAVNANEAFHLSPFVGPVNPIAPLISEPIMAMENACTGAKTTTIAAVIAIWGKKPA